VPGSLEPDPEHVYVYTSMIYSCLIGMNLYMPLSALIPISNPSYLYLRMVYLVSHVTPGLEKVTECIPYVRQDQVPHIQ
jgi:hypothetical protein